jgi:hypothetical protein
MPTSLKRIELVYGVTFCVTGDRVVPGETSIVISNHPTLLDFFVLLKFSTLAVSAF